MHLKEDTLSTRVQPYLNSASVRGIFNGILYQATERFMQGRLRYTDWNHGLKSQFKPDLAMTMEWLYFLQHLRDPRFKVDFRFLLVPGKVEFFNTTLEINPKRFRRVMPLNQGNQQILALENEPLNEELRLKVPLLAYVIGFVFELNEPPKIPINDFVYGIDASLILPD